MLEILAAVEEAAEAVEEPVEGGFGVRVDVDDVGVAAGVRAVFGMVVLAPVLLLRLLFGLFGRLRGIGAASFLAEGSEGWRVEFFVEGDGVATRGLDGGGAVRHEL